MNLLLIAMLTASAQSTPQSLHTPQVPGHDEAPGVPVGMVQTFLDHLPTGVTWFEGTWEAPWATQLPDATHLVDAVEPIPPGWSEAIVSAMPETPTRFRVVQISNSDLAIALATHLSGARMALFPDLTVDIRPGRVWNDATSVTWNGEVGGDLRHHLHITVRGQHVVGSAKIGDNRYRLFKLAAGTYAIAEYAGREVSHAQ